MLVDVVQYLLSSGDRFAVFFILERDPCIKWVLEPSLPPHTEGDREG